MADRESLIADPGLRLVRDGMLVLPGRIEIDFRTPDYSVWLTIKADAEAVASALDTAFGDKEEGHA